MKAHVSAAGQWFRERSFWVALVGSVAVLIALAGWTGRTAHARTEAWRERAHAVARTEAVAGRWARQLAPVTAAERRAWAGSAAAVDERGIAARDRVALLQDVTERAEALGLRDLALNFVAADTIAAVVDRQVDGRRFRAAPYALSLRATTPRMAGLLRLVENLPPQVEVARFDAVAVPEGVEARLLLLVFLADGRGAADGG